MHKFSKGVIACTVWASASALLAGDHTCNQGCKTGCHRPLHAVVDLNQGPQDLTNGCARCNPGYEFSLWENYCETRTKLVYTPYVRQGTDCQLQGCLGCQQRGFPKTGCVEGCPSGAGKANCGCAAPSSANQHLPHPIHAPGQVGTSAPLFPSPSAQPAQMMLEKTEATTGGSNGADAATESPSDGLGLDEVRGLETPEIRVLHRMIYLTHPTVNFRQSHRLKTRLQRNLNGRIEKWIS